MLWQNSATGTKQVGKWSTGKEISGKLLRGCCGLGMVLLSPVPPPSNHTVPLSPPIFPFALAKLGIFNDILLISFWWTRTNRRKHSSCITKTPGAFWKSTGEVPPLSTGLQWFSPRYQPASHCCSTVLHQPCAKEVAPMGSGGHREFQTLFHKLVKAWLNIASAANSRSRKLLLN